MVLGWIIGSCVLGGRLREGLQDAGESVKEGIEQLGRSYYRAVKYQTRMAYQTALAKLRTLPTIKKKIIK